MTQYIIYSDGGARGNPGPAAFGFLIKSQKPIFNFKFLISNEIQISNDKKEIRGSKFIGNATNNQAEYQGILMALKKMAEIFAKKPPKDQYKIICRLDSELIVEQMNGRYKIKNEGLKPLYWEIRELIMKLENRVVFEHIAREFNKETDKLVNKAIDNNLKLKSQNAK